MKWRWKGNTPARMNSCLPTGRHSGVDSLIHMIARIRLSIKATAVVGVFTNLTYKTLFDLLFDPALNLPFQICNSLYKK